MFSRTTRLEGLEDGRDEDNGDYGGGQDVPHQKHLSVLRVGSVQGYNFFYRTTTQFWEDMNIRLLEYEIDRAPVTGVSILPNFSQ